MPPFQTRRPFCITSVLRVRGGLRKSLECWLTNTAHYSRRWLNGRPGRRRCCQTTRLWAIGCFESTGASSTKKCRLESRMKNHVHSQRNRQDSCRTIMMRSSQACANHIAPHGWAAPTDTDAQTHTRLNTSLNLTLQPHGQP